MNPWLSFLISGVVAAGFCSNSLTYAAKKAAESGSSPQETPALIKGKASFSAIKEEVEDALKSKKLDAKTKEKYVNEITRYMAFLGLDPELPMFKKTLSRLLNSSTQFLLCDENDWACLEKTPELVPSSDYRVETKKDLGTPVDSNEELKMEAFFTRRWNSNDPKTEKIEPTVASTLAKKIRDDASKKLSVAIYGIDDIKGSMKPVYEALVDQANRGIESVFDVSAEAGPNAFLRTYNVEFGKGGEPAVLKLNGPLVFSYLAPGKKDLESWVFGRPSWMDKLMKMADPADEDEDEEDDEEEEAHEMAKYIEDMNWFMRKPGRSEMKETMENAVRMSFQYNGSSTLIRKLNENIKSDDKALARLEWPTAGIMHNKFLVMEDKSGQKAVWSGTTNIARTCMGDELNSNMAVYIKNKSVAGAFEAEFKEMFDFTDKISDSSLKNLVNGNKKKDIPMGKFHTNKKPDTQRYFRFKDGSEVRVHFSPTDDGEHRAILPMLLSAQKGDVIRVAMFGGAGIEMVRAFQYAQAKGADVKIILDRTTGAQGGSWVRSPDAKVQDDNPYLQDKKRFQKPGTIEARMDDWKGLNHHKTATLTRKLNGGNTRAEVLIVGSQNWTVGGNDSNDENMLTIRNTTQGIAAAEQFNEVFDNEMWAQTVEPQPKKPAKEKDKKKKLKSFKPDSLKHTTKH